MYMKCNKIIKILLLNNLWYMLQAVTSLLLFTLRTTDPDHAVLKNTIQYSGM